MESVFQLFKFAAVGCVNTLIDWAIYFIVLMMFPAESVLFYTVAKGFSYFANNKQLFLISFGPLKKACMKTGRQVCYFFTGKPGWPRY